MRTLTEIDAEIAVTKATIDRAWRDAEIAKQSGHHEERDQAVGSHTRGGG